MTSPDDEKRLPVAALTAACGVFLLVAGVILAGPLLPFRLKDNALPNAPQEKHGVPAAALQKTFRLTVPAGARDVSYLMLPGDGSAESGQDLYLRFRSTPDGLKAFVTSLGTTAGDLTAGDAALDQDDIDSVELPWKVNTTGRLGGLHVEIPEQGDTMGTALLTVDETEPSAPLISAHVTL
ncbi:hypothetical protein [Streptomyces sp. TLI_55]|uniref:hypothetical protein n=1 Tax=Streptomyces sp. TLI_55 TaxID=1938861 RepID=UPI00117F5909|nr:hypothetical protein [Streptomyces sp. TLI_55]